MTGGEVQVWSLELSTVTDAAWTAFHAVLDEAERARAARFRRDRDRLTYTAAHGLLRRLLGQETGRDPAGLCFEAGPGGKPRMADGSGPAFNLSHTRGVVVVALSGTGEVGVDVEPLDRSLADLAIADHYFAPAEAAALHGLPGRTAQVERFLRLWTLKEAYIKATGKGLAQPLADFAFLSLDPPLVTFYDAALGNPGDWHFWQQTVGGHMIALAVRSCAVRVVHHEVAPDESSRLIGG